MKSKKTAWNKNKDVGQKRPFAPEHLEAIARNLENTKQFRNLCLFCLGIDTMLRSVDLLRLKVCDVAEPNGHIKQVFVSRQKKNKKPVKSSITPYTASAICCHVASHNLKPHDFLFTAKRNPLVPFSTSYLRRLVKSWAGLVDLDPQYYSGHSLRRTAATVADIAWSEKP